MTTAADFLADAAKPPITFDFANRYVMPHPETGESVPWTRATTWASSPSDTFGITRWQLRTCARGMAMRRDLCAAIAADYDDDKVVDKAIADAQEHAGSTVAATTGTALHRLVERTNKGEDLTGLPADLADRVDAYEKLLEQHGMVVTAAERIVCVPELMVAGTLDMILLRSAGSTEAWIGDLKTGRDLTPAWPEIAIQLSLYAHASYIWNGEGWDPMPAVNRQRAFVAHVPALGGDATLYEVDIEAGWAAATGLCGPVREWRKRRNLAQPCTDFLEAGSPNGDSPGAVEDRPVGPVSAPSGDRAGWITGRLKALAGNERARTLVAQNWPDGTTVKPPWTNEQIDALAQMLDGVEGVVDQPFGQSDPAVQVEPERPEPEPTPEWVPSWDVEDDGVIADDDDVAALAAVVKHFDPDRVARLKALSTAAKTVGRPFDARRMTLRQWTCARAAISCVRGTTDDDAIRKLLEAVLGQWGPDWVLGGVIGSLSVVQAEQLADWADAPF